MPNDQRVAFAWNSRTNHLLTHRESWLNEPRLERDGRYIALTNGNSTFRLWDLDTNTFGPTQSSNLYWLGHNADLRSLWVTTDVNASAPFDLDRYAPAGGQIVRTRIFNNSAGPAVHHSGNWVQSDAELGGDLNRQWSVFSGVYNDWVYNVGPLRPVHRGGAAALRPFRDRNTRIVRSTTLGTGGHALCLARILLVTRATLPPL